MDKYFESFIKNEQSKDYFKNINNALIIDNNNYYPPKDNIYEAFKYSSYNDINVIIIGQDPYHEEGQAHGLAFSVLNNKAPKSLINIFKEIESDTGHIRTNTNLTDWAKQGVLLLNTTLTVRCHEANSHKNIGWHTFTDNVIKEFNKRNDKIIFILWGNDARSKKYIIDTNKHYILESAHPSPLSAYHGFFGSKVFSKCNELLKKENKKEIKWWD